MYGQPMQFVVLQGLGNAS